jgi:hypothetical protein
MLKVCLFCGDALGVMPGPRNTKQKDLCKRPACRRKALLTLKEAGLLTEEEEKELSDG